MSVGKKNTPNKPPQGGFIFRICRTKRNLGAVNILRTSLEDLIKAMALTALRTLAPGHFSSCDERANAKAQTSETPPHHGNQNTQQ